jgi:hypothetical protein
MRFSLPLFAATFSALFPPFAAAQSRDPFENDQEAALLRPDVAGSRQPPGFEQNGIQVGSMIVKADAKATIAGNSNILNRSQNERGDVYVVFEPTATLTSDWGRHQLAVKANAAVARFASVTRQNRETFGLEASGRLDFARQSSAFTRVSFARKVEPRDAPGEASIDGSPAEYNQVEAQIGARVEEGNLRVATAATATKRDYADIIRSNGQSDSQRFRDSSTLTINVRADYALPSGAIAFVTGTGSRIESANAAQCCDRSGAFGQAMVGIRADLAPLVTAKIALGYSFRNFDAGRFKDVNGLIYQAKVDWYPTPLISLTASARRDIVNSGIPAVGGIVVSEVGLQVHYELRRNFNLIFNAMVADENYRDANVSATSRVVGVEGRYIVTPQWTGGVFTRLRGRSTDDLTIVRNYSGFEGGLWLKYEL